MGMNPFFGGQHFLPQNMMSPAFGFGGMRGFGNGGGLQGWGGGLGGGGFGGFGGGGQIDVYNLIALGLWDPDDLESYLEQMFEEASMQGIQIGADMQQYRDLVQMARQQQQQQVNVFVPGGGYGRGQGRARDQRFWKQLARGGGGGAMWGGMGGMGGNWRGGWGGGWGGNGPRRGMGWNGVNRPGQLRLTGSPSPYNVPFNLRLTRS